jgi:hypothetical protein
MAIDTAAKRRNVAGIGFWLFGPGVTPDATPGVDWRQAVGWGYLGIEAAGSVVVPGNAILDMNTRIAVYLRALYTAPGADVTTLIIRYLAAQTGEYTARFKKLITDATA